MAGNAKGRFGPLVGAIDQGTSSTRFMVRERNISVFGLGETRVAK